MPPFLVERTLGLPRWAWLTIMVGGGGLGLYLRLHNDEEEIEDVEEERSLNSGNVMPKAPGVTAEGGGVSGGGGFEVSPGGKQETLPEVVTVPPTVELPTTETPAEVELPESGPPPENVTETEHSNPEATPERRNPPPPVQHETISAPGTPSISPAVDLGSGGGGQGPGSEGHPRAVDTGNLCVRGGVGGHSAPPGYHLYCGGNGHIWRAPN